MTDRPKPGGYIWRAEVAKAVNANRQARHYLKILLENNLTGRAARYALIAQISQHLSANLDSLMTLADIGNVNLQAFDMEIDDISADGDV